MTLKFCNERELRYWQPGVCDTWTMPIHSNTVASFEQKCHQKLSLEFWPVDNVPYNDYDKS